MIIFHPSRIKEEVDRLVPRTSSNAEGDVKEEQDEFERRVHHTMKQAFDRMSKTLHLHRMHWPVTRRGTTTSPSSPTASVREGRSHHESDATELSHTRSRVRALVHGPYKNAWLIRRRTWMHCGSRRAKTEGSRRRTVWSEEKASSQKVRQGRVETYVLHHQFRRCA